MFVTQNKTFFLLALTSYLLKIGNKVCIEDEHRQRGPQ